MLNASLKELSAALAQRKISSAELTRLFLTRVEKLNASLNAFITVDPEKSLAQARAADERIAKGATQPLTGIPVAHKDIFVTRSWLTTCGSRILSNFVGPYDAHVIERFNGAGGHGNGHRRLDSPARRALGSVGAETDLRARIALRHDRLRLQPRSGRPIGKKRRRPCAPSERDGRVRCARFDLGRARGRRLPPRIGQTAGRSSHRRAEGALRRGAGRSAPS